MPYLTKITIDTTFSQTIYKTVYMNQIKLFLDTNYFIIYCIELDLKENSVLFSPLALKWPNIVIHWLYTLQSHFLSKNVSMSKTMNPRNTLVMSHIIAQPI